MFAAGMFLLVGMVALAVDAGFIMAERRQVQSAADAAALAAAKAKLDYLYESNVESVQIDTGKRYGARNADTSEDRVNVDPDPGMDGFDDVYVDGVNRYVQVEISKDVESFFLRALYQGDWGVSAEAIAGMEPIQIPYALVALDCGPDDVGIEIDGGGTIDVNEGSIMSNCGINASGDSNIVTAEGAIDAYGLIQDNENWSAGEGINENRPRISDPVAESGITKPLRTDAQDVRIVDDDESMQAAVTNLGSQTNPHRCPSGETCVMQPGYYGGELAGLNVHGTLFMEPGLYFFGDEFLLEGQSSSTRFEGSDVSLYFTDSAQFDPKHARLQLTAEGDDESNCESELESIVLWIDNGSPFLMQSNGKFEFGGVMYAPHSHVRLFGGGDATGVQVIVESLELAGSQNFDLLYRNCFEGDSEYVFLVQ